jgi:hypothetical protein
MKGSEKSQNRKKDTKWTVVVPELGIPFWMPPVSSAYRSQFVSSTNGCLGTYITPVIPYSADHEIHTVAANPGLYAVPNAGHGGAVEDWPQGTPNSEGSAIDYRERDVVRCSNSTCQTDEAGRNGVAKLY